MRTDIPAAAPLARTTRILVCLALVALATPLSAWAETFYDISVGLNVSDEDRIFLNLTNKHFAPPDRVSRTIVTRCQHPQDDYPVIMFLARTSGHPADRILALRLEGRVWADIFFELRVSPVALFRGLDRDPGPPYGKAWGHWKKHRTGRRLALADADIVELTKLQIAAGYYRIDPYDVVAASKRGISVERFAASRYEAKNRPGKNGMRSAHVAKKAKQAAPYGKGKGKNKSKH